VQKVLLIGASGGIGNKVAQLLTSLGYEVLGTYYKHPQHLDNLKPLTNFQSRYVDIQDPSSLKKIKNDIAPNSLYAIVNCSGIIEFETEDKDEINIWNKTIATNLSGNYFLARIFNDQLIENGRFLMISSTDSYFGGTITASYAASKAGVNSLTKSLCLMFQSKKIRVNSIAPGWVHTPMVAANGGEFFNKVAEINPLKRNASPEDVANLIKFLLSIDSNYINGQVISLEGGYTNQDPTLLLEQNIQIPQEGVKSEQ